MSPGRGNGLTVDTPDAELLPLADALQRSLAIFFWVEALGQRHLVAPGLASLPIRVLEIARGRGKRIGHVVPDIALAVAVIIDGISLIGRGDELRVAHGAGPRAVHRLDTDVAALENLERGDELLPGEARLGVVIGERGERADHVHVAGLGAVIQLHPPDGDDDGAIDAVALLQNIEQRLVLLELLLAAGDALIGDDAIDIFADRLFVFRLEIRRLDHLGVRRHALEREIVSLSLDACRPGGRPESFDPLAESLRRLGTMRQADDGRRRKREQGKGKNEGSGDSHERELSNPYG